jgi:sulfite exporter TauE/SafE
MISYPDLLAAVTIGLMGSTHCIAMCGGIAATLNMGVHEPSRRWPRLLGFHAGRLLSYTAIGLLLGGLLASATEHLAMLTLLLRVIAGLLLIAMGLYIANWWHGLTRLEQFGAPLWARLQPLVKQLLPVTSVGRALALGSLWGWLPCGLVYSTLSWAVSADHAVNAAARMFFFGLGTLPAMLTLSLASDRSMRWMRQSGTRRLAGLLLILYGVWTLAMPLWHQLPGTMESHAAHGH